MLDDGKSKLRLLYEKRVIFMHVDGYENMSPSFARGLIHFVNSDDAHSHTLAASMPKPLADRLRKYLTKHGFSLQCARYENGMEVEHLIRRRSK